jgi:hypothetical protein
MAGVNQKDIDFVSAYDAFTFTSLIQLEAYGFCGRGARRATSRQDGRLKIDGPLPPIFPAAIYPRATLTVSRW